MILILLKKFDNKVGHLRRYSVNSFKSLFEQNGFKVVETVKNEGIFRNLLFTNETLGELIRLFKGPISDFVTFLDMLTLYMFGESNIILTARKI